MRNTSWQTHHFHKMPPKSTVKARHHGSASRKTPRTNVSRSTSRPFSSTNWDNTNLLDHDAVVNAIKSIDGIKSVPQDERDCLIILMSKLSRAPLELLFARYVDKDKNTLPSQLKGVRESIVSSVMLERASASNTTSMLKPNTSTLHIKKESPAYSESTHTTEKRMTTSNLVTPLKKKTKNSPIMISVG